MDHTIKLPCFHGFNGSIYPSSGYGGATDVITARIYRSNTPDNIFKPLPGAAVSVETTGLVTSPIYRYKLNEQLFIRVNAGERLLLTIDTHMDPGYTAFTSISAHWGGSIKIE